MPPVRLPFKTVIVDFDGVIVESNGIKDKAFELLFSAYPTHLKEILSYHRQTTKIRFEKFRYIYTQILKKAYTTEIEQRLGEEFSRFTIAEVVRCQYVPGAIELLEWLYPSLPLYMVSVNPSADLEVILSARGLSRYFKKVYAVNGSKTSALLEILTQEQIVADDAIFIGDSLEDCLAAKAAKVPFLGRMSCYSFADEGVPCVADLHGVKKYLMELG